MAVDDKKLSELTELAATPAASDQIYILDESEALADKSKRISVANFLATSIAHIAATVVHGAVSAATASKIVSRDASGRSKFAAPAGAGDALIKGTRHLIAEMPTLTTDKAWKGVAGVPTEVDWPAGAAAIVPVTLVVAASDSLDPTRADYQCNGVNDHVEIQAAIDALLATGGEVQLLDGTYNVQATINLDSNQTLRGCGRNTILTTATANLVFLSAVGGSGTEKIGIVITDLQIDGATISDIGIYFEYVDYSFVQNVYSRRHTGGLKCGIYLLNSDFNRIANNTCQENTSYGIHIRGEHNTVTGNTCTGNQHGIYLWTGYNTVTGNICQGNTLNGIDLSPTNNNTVTGNTCAGNGKNGIDLSGSDNNTISGNTCHENNEHGIYLYLSDNNVFSGNNCQGNAKNGFRIDTSNHNVISGNNCQANSQAVDNTYSNIDLDDSDYNLIVGNVCRQGALAGKPKYGINVSADNCDRNCLIGNDLYDSGATGDLNDVPTTNPTLKHDNRNLAGTGWLAEV